MEVENTQYHFGHIVSFVYLSNLRTPPSFETIVISSFITPTLDIWYRLQDTRRIFTWCNPLKSEPIELILLSEIGSTSALAQLEKKSPPNRTSQA